MQPAVAAAAIEHNGRSVDEPCCGRGQKSDCLPNILWRAGPSEIIGLRRLRFTADIPRTDGVETYFVFARLVRKIFHHAHCGKRRGNVRGHAGQSSNISASRYVHYDAAGFVHVGDGIVHKLEQRVDVCLIAYFPIFRRSFCNAAPSINVGADDENIQFPLPFFYFGVQTADFLMVLEICAEWPLCAVHLREITRRASAGQNHQSAPLQKGLRNGPPVVLRSKTAHHDGNAAV